MSTERRSVLDRRHASQHYLHQPLVWDGAAQGSAAQERATQESATQESAAQESATLESAAQDDINAQLRQANEQLVKTSVKLQQANEQLVIASVRLQAMTEELQKTLHLASHDFLTDLPNRMQLLDRVVQAIAWARRHRSRFAVLFLDLDRFKSINDTLGHAIGDQLLQSVAERLMSIIRCSDTASRHGGDEFVLVLTEVDHRDTLASKADDIRSILSAPYNIAGHELEIGVTIGISVFPDDGEDAEMLIRNADAAMYCAKENGRNQCQFFRPEMDMPDHRS